jgi:subtilisin family serine protease
MRPAYSRESTVLRLDQVARMDGISPTWAWGGATGKGVRVAVIDSGIEADHPDLEGCVEVDKGVAIVPGVDGAMECVPGPHDDSFGHATACAGIIHSIAPEARLTSVKVIGTAESTSSDMFFAGLNWAIDQHYDVINLSLGTRRRDWALAFYQLCDRAYFAGCFVVTAANNVMVESFPSLYASVASVASNMSQDPFRFHFNPDPPTEFLAPGIDIDLAWRDHSRMTGTGNSYAAPHITGIAALIKSKHPDLRPFQIKTVLWATAANVQEAPEAAGRLTRVGGGTRSRATRAGTMIRRLA